MQILLHVVGMAPSQQHHMAKPERHAFSDVDVAIAAHALAVADVAVFVP